ncbi:MAG: hypothetical protein ABSD20_15280 [Terriglobales bacterium]
MSDRKYRQHGYMDRTEARSESTAKPKPKDKDMTYGPRTIQMAPTRTVSRCGQCGVVLNANIDPTGNCPQCGVALHACKQCTYFDPGSRFECRQPVPDRILSKVARNQCTFFSLSARLERETTSSSAANPSRVADARRAFDSLFKQ